MGRHHTLTETMKTLGINQSQLAERLGMSKSVMSRMVNGRTTVRRVHLLACCYLISEHRVKASQAPHCAHPVTRSRQQTPAPYHRP